MAPRLKHVDPNRPRGAFSRAYARFSGTRLARFISAKVVWKLDPYVLRATRGRFGMGLVLPTALLETRGAKSGALRRNAVIYFHDGDRVTIVASKAGHEKHPAWFHNLRAHPDVTFAGIPMRATVVVDEAERERLWTLADRVFAPYAAYRREAAKVNRTIPIVQLTPSKVEVELLSPDAAGDRALMNELARIVNEAYAVGEAGLWVEGTVRTTPEQVADTVRDGDLLAASLADRLVGCVRVRAIDAATAQLGLLSTAPDQWGYGIGGDLVRAAEDLARARGAATMELVLLDSTDPAHPGKGRLRTWYEARGYRFVRAAPIEEVSLHAAAELAARCEWLVFCKPLR
jgi:deazaflavin-dependent oxidoreductase (nitroreductase family)